MRSLGSAIGTALLPWCLTGCGTEGGPTGPDRAQGPGGEKPPSLTVAPVIGVSPTSLKFLVYAFRPNYDPPAQTLRLKNLWGGVLRWTVSDNGYWLTVGPTLGSGPATLTVRVHRKSIPIGLNGYRPQGLTATITISATGASNSPVKVPVGVLISYVH